MTKTLAFRNDVQAALWEEELTGQISDGKWENARPLNHWEVWCDADVIVDPDGVGRNFHVTKCNYDLNSMDLLDCVGDRMLALARLVRRYGLADGVLFYELYSWDGTIRDLSPDRYPGERYDRIRENIVTRLKALGISADDLELVVKDVRETPSQKPFGLKELRAELKDMKKIIKNEAC